MPTGMTVLIAVVPVGISRIMIDVSGQAVSTNLACVRDRKSAGARRMSAPRWPALM
jgi:hypothetical protein